MARSDLGVCLSLVLLLIVSLTSGLNEMSFADDPTAKSTGPAVGEALPELEGVDEQGIAWESAEQVGKGPLVIYFYPGDFTGGCIKQAQKFQELVEKFREAGAEVVGVSGDDRRGNKRPAEQKPPHLKPLLPFNSRV